jgi:hypothetical protein
VRFDFTKTLEEPHFASRGSIIHFLIVEHQTVARHQVIFVITLHLISFTGNQQRTIWSRQYRHKEPFQIRCVVLTVCNVQPHGVTLISLPECRHTLHVNSLVISMLSIVADNVVISAHVSLQLFNQCQLQEIHFL